MSNSFLNNIVWISNAYWIKKIIFNVKFLNILRGHLRWKDKIRVKSEQIFSSFLLFKFCLKWIRRFVTFYISIMWQIHVLPISYTKQIVFSFKGDNIFLLCISLVRSQIRVQICKTMYMKITKMQITKGMDKTATNLYFTWYFTKRLQR